MEADPLGVPAGDRGVACGAGEVVVLHNHVALHDPDPLVGHTHLLRPWRVPYLLLLHWTSSFHLLSSSASGRGAVRCLHLRAASGVVASFDRLTPVAENGASFEAAYPRDLRSPMTALAVEAGGMTSSPEGGGAGRVEPLPASERELRPSRTLHGQRVEVSSLWGRHECC